MYPLVSVIITTYKRSEHILRSVNSVLKQTYKNIEIIVIDDNNKGDHFSLFTEKLLEPFIKSEKIIYINHQTNKGVSAARNTGIKKAKGEYIAFLDDDDEYLPDKIFSQVEVFKNSKDNIGLVYGSFIQVNVETKQENFFFPKLRGNIHDILGLNHIGTPSMIMCKRLAIQKIGGFDESLDHKEDIDFYLRLSKYFFIDFTNKLLIRYYVHAGSASKNDKDRLEKMLIFIKKHKNIIKKPGVRWSEVQERLAELYFLNNLKIKAIKVFFLAYIAMPLRIKILAKIFLLIVGKKTLNFKFK
jgi:glycosyltransferase involved in cell wall biosynthesis